MASRLASFPQSIPAPNLTVGPAFLFPEQSFLPQQLPLKVTPLLFSEATHTDPAGRTRNQWNRCSPSSICCMYIAHGHVCSPYSYVCFTVSYYVASRCQCFPWVWMMLPVSPLAAATAFLLALVLNFAVHREAIMKDAVTYRLQ